MNQNLAIAALDYEFVPLAVAPCPLMSFEKGRGRGATLVNAEEITFPDFTGEAMGLGVVDLEAKQLLFVCPLAVPITLVAGMTAKVMKGAFRIEGEPL